MSLTYKPLNDSAETSRQTPAPAAQPLPLRVSVEQALKRYFAHLDGQGVCGLYDLVLAEVEAPLLQETLAYAAGNQSRAAQLLGLNRGTLRKKLKQYDLL